MIGKCTKCWSLMPLTRHHIKPRCRGGGHEPENIRLVCRPCHDELDLEIGVRLIKKPKRSPVRRQAGCIKCGNSVPKRLQLGIMQRADVNGLCQRCAWERERNLWHELRESLQRKKLEESRPINSGALDQMIHESGIARWK